MLFSRALIETVADFLEEHRVPLVVDPVMVASSGAKLLEDDAVETLVSRLFPLATVVTPNLPRPRRSPVGGASRRELAERLHELGAPAAIVTGGHGDPVDHLFDGASTSRSRSSGTTSPRRTAPAARTRRRSPRCSRAGCRARGRGARRARAARDAVAHGLVELGAGEGRSTSST
jgi:hydroxymethylpyrimidine/phosphomethylpyrimidine kinase